MSQKPIEPNNKYFTVSLSADGFTDQLTQFSAFYRLGSSLGYEYIHTHFSTKRSAESKCRTFGRLPKLLKKVRKQWARITNRGTNANFNIHDYLGINQLLHSLSSKVPQEASYHFPIPLSDRVLQINGIENYHQLKDYLDGLIKDVPPEAILEFKLQGSREKVFTLVNECGQTLSEILDLQAYSSIQPTDSLFASQESGTRILVHIRQGDTSILETPWKTWIPVKYYHKDFLVEAENPEDIEQTHAFTIKEYCEFLQPLLSKLQSAQVTTACFSDGFKRAIDILLAHSKKLHLDPSQIEALLRRRKIIDQDAFAPLARIPNVSLEIGESDPQLRQLVATAMDAHVIITSSQQRMLQKFVSFYSGEESPLVIVLHRTSETPYCADLVSAPHRRFLFVNIDKPDFGNVVKRILEKPKSLNEISGLDLSRIAQK